MATKKQTEAARRNVKRAACGDAEAHHRQPAGTHAAGAPDETQKGAQRHGQPGYALEDRNRRQLYELAQRKNIPGRSNMGKSELIAAIRRAG
jgi:Rho termination factor, N-terminal domain